MTDMPALITAAELQRDDVLLDVREPDEWAAGHIDGALAVPMGSVVQRVGSDPEAWRTERALVVVCKAGGRASRVASWLNANGFPAAVLDGGMLTWHNEGRPMVSDTGLPPTVL